MCDALGCRVKLAMVKSNRAAMQAMLQSVPYCRIDAWRALRSSHVVLTLPSEVSKGLDS